jgi:hypothetical protein
VIKKLGCTFSGVALLGFVFNWSKPFVQEYKNAAPTIKIAAVVHVKIDVLMFFIFGFS